MAAEFESLLKEYSARAEGYVQKIKNADIHAVDCETIHELLLGYVGNKFMLDPEEMTSDVFSELSEISIEKVAGIPKGDLSIKDISMNCAGISSVETKKILLLVALKKSLEIDIDPYVTPKIKTVQELAVIVYNALDEKSREQI